MLERLNNKRGSAIIMALVTITILLVLGMAVITLSMGTLTTNVADATTNDTYYAAEAGINSAIEQVKAEVVKYYAQMSEASGGDYTSLYDNFFPGIASNSSANFDEPEIQNMNTITTFSAGRFNTEENTGDILISCEAIAPDGTKYVVNGSVNVQRIDLRSGGKWLMEPYVLYTGGKLTMLSGKGMQANNADVMLGGLEENGGELKYNKNLIINPFAGDQFGDTLSYAPPNMSGKPISIHVTASNNTISSLWQYSEPLYITSDPGVTVTFQNDTIVDGIIYISGDVVLNSGGSVYADIYCDGNLTNKGRELRGNVYCKGSITMTGGQIRGSMFAEGPISIVSAGGDGGVIYSCTELRLGDWQASGIYFSGGDVAITGNPGITGMLIAKGNVYFTSSSGWPRVHYQQNYIDKVKNDPDNAFFFGGGSGGSGGGGNTPTSDVIKGQTMTAIGRIN